MAERRKRVVQPWLRVLGGVLGALLVVFVFVVGPWLLTRYPHRGLTAEQELKAKNDVRTTLVQALAGLAVAGGLAVTYRTFRHNRVEQDRSYELRKAEQVNELYTKAVEQLGHKEAPVRLGALYSLAHLAQANPQQRQTVVDVMCAYLRMPYRQPNTAESTYPKRDPAQELQVRLTAQRLLADHLRVPEAVSAQDAQDLLPAADKPFWPGISLDLANATLVNVNFNRASTVHAWFDGATFSGDAFFTGAAFTGNAVFVGASFTGFAAFEGATFSGEASFYGVTFTRTGIFVKATFTSVADFNDAKFLDQAAFIEAVFAGIAKFSEAAFTTTAWFDRAAFHSGAWFDKATFDNSSDAKFHDARFVLPVPPEDAEKSHIYRQAWPPGWMVHSDANDPTHGTLVPAAEDVGSGGSHAGVASAVQPL